VVNDKSKSGALREDLLQIYSGADKAWCQQKYEKFHSVVFISSYLLEAATIFYTFLLFPSYFYYMSRFAYTVMFGYALKSTLRVFEA